MTRRYFIITDRLSSLTLPGRMELLGLLLVLQYCALDQVYSVFLIEYQIWT